MSKRILALLLVLALLVPVIPQSARAEELQRVIITTVSEWDDPLVVYAGDFDLYFSEEDLMLLSYEYDYYNDGKTATYTRGSKNIIIDLAKGKFTVRMGGKNPFSRTMDLPMEKIGDVWYYSGATLLPWLNVNVSVADGKLVVIPDEYSYWDIYGKLDLSKYSLDLGELLKQYSWKSKVVKAMQYYSDSTSQALQEKMGLDDEYNSSGEDYFDVLEWYLLDTAHTEYMVEAICDNINYFGDYAGMTLPDIELLSLLFDIFDFVDEGIVFAVHYYAFTTQHDDRMQLITEILNSSPDDIYTKQVITGAELASDTYSNWWHGVLNKYVLNLDEALASLLIDKIQDKLSNNLITDAILLAMDISSKEIKSLNRRIELMPALVNLYYVGREVYESNYSQHTLNLSDLRCHGILSLFAAAENYRTLATYSEEHRLYDLAKKYRSLAEECDHWISQLNACALSQVNDSFNYRNGSTWENDKSRYTDDLMAMFMELDYYEIPPEGLESVEYGMFLAYAEELSLEDLNWKLLNREGSDGFVLYGNTEYKGKTYLLEQYLNVATLTSQFGQPTDGYVPDGDSPDLTDQVISGDTGKLMTALDRYLSYRQNFLSDHTADLNADGKQDMLFVISGAATLWLDALDVRSQYKALCDATLPADRKDTLVLAETTKNGLHVRIMRVDSASDYQLSPDGTLTADGTTYTYQSEGDPFAGAADYLLDYSHLTYGELYDIFWASAYSSPQDGNVWNYACMLGEGLGMVFTFASDYEDPNARAIFISIDDFLYYSGDTCGVALCPGLEFGMTYREAAKNLDITQPEFAPEQRWTEPVYVCYSSAMGCALELYFVGSDPDDAVLVSIYATPVG